MIACHAAAADAAGVVQLPLLNGQPVSISTVIGFKDPLTAWSLLEASDVESIIGGQGPLCGS